MSMRLFPLAAALCFSASMAAAQDGEYPMLAGFAAAQAAEAGLGACFGIDMAETVGCAVAECMELSGLGEADCAPNLWCYPHRWVADIFMQHAEGPHWHKFVCDQPDRAQLERVVALECDLDYLIACEAVRIWDMDGNQLVGE
jgi:hypothetical protein